MIKSIRIKKCEAIFIENWLKENESKLKEKLTPTELLHVLIYKGLQQIRVDKNGCINFK